MPKVTVVIVSFQVKELLRNCLRSVLDQSDIDLELIVIDNASSDGSADMVRRDFPSVTLIASPVNAGFSPANNEGIQRSTGDYILLLNPDTVVKQGAFSTWVSHHALSKSGISGPRLLNADGSLQISAWKVPGLLASLAELFFLHRLLKTGNYSADKFDSDFQPEALSGAALLFSRDIGEQTGGLDPELFWMEDVDLCYRIRKDGFTVQYFHEPEIIHLSGKSSAGNLHRVISNQLLSRIKFSSKHRGTLITAFLHLIVFLHILSRILVFHLLLPIIGKRKAFAYRYTFKKYFRYLFFNDRSI